VTIIGTSGRISHNATAIFRFTASASPGFTITASSSVSFASGQTATSDVKVDHENGFSSQVELAATVSPSTGLSVSLNPFSLANGSGTSTATFRSFTQGNYTVIPQLLMCTLPLYRTPHLHPRRPQDLTP